MPRLLLLYKSRFLFFFYFYLVRSNHAPRKKIVLAFIYDEGVLIKLSDAETIFPGFHPHKFPGHYFQCFLNLIRSVPGL